MREIQETFSKLLLSKGIQINDQQLQQFEVYFHELVSWNEKMNLTGITEYDQVFMKHFYDSISLSFFVPVSSVETLVDIGSGAGFPSIPLKIMFPHLKITIVDSLNKRIRFLEHLCKALLLDDVNCIHGRAEEIARMPQYRDHFDVAAARAVARMNVLNELCLPFVKKDGFFIAMKGSDPEEEVNEAKFSLKELQGRLEGIHSFQLPEDHAQRHMIIVKKMKATPAKYPRKSGVPMKQPLIKN